MYNIVGASLSKLLNLHMNRLSLGLRLGLGLGSTQNVVANHRESAYFSKGSIYVRYVL